MFAFIYFVVIYIIVFSFSAKLFRYYRVSLSWLLYSAYLIHVRLTLNYYDGF